MPKATNRLPKYRKHASGRAVVRINGQDHYLGPYGTKASRTEYDLAIGEWQANGRCALTPTGGKDPFAAEVLAAFWGHAKVYYRHPDDTATSELKN